MKKFLAVLGAAAVTLLLVTPALPAQAAPPSPAVSVSAAVSADCVATVKVDWRGVKMDYISLKVNVWSNVGLGTSGYIEVPITKQRGKATYVLTGTPSALNTGIYVSAELAGGPFVYDQVTVAPAPCIDWVRVS